MNRALLMRTAAAAALVATCHQAYQLGRLPADDPSGPVDLPNITTFTPGPSGATTSVTINVVNTVTGVEYAGDLVLIERLFRGLS